MKYESDVIMENQNTVKFWPAYKSEFWRGTQKLQ